MINFSIIVCTYNRCEYLKETIESIIESLRDRNDCELLIIDNNSTDQTNEIVKSFAHLSSVKYFLETNQGLSHARNRGIKEAQGEIIVYLDDDIELPSNYFDICDEIFKDAAILISGGKVLPFKVEIPEWLPKKYYFLVSVYDLGNEPKFVKYLMGGNFAIRREVAKKIGSYSTELGRKGQSLAGGEEIDYQNRAKELGYKMFYHPEQNILHKINEKLNETYVLKYAFELGKSEKIIDQSLSTNRVKIKLLKSHIAIIAYSLLRGILTKGKSLSYIRIINQYAKGYKK
jgi:glycosyltransferase involved in cell wall biosynthesis